MRWKKELVDQPLHALWSGGSVGLVVVAWRIQMPLWSSILLTAAALASLAGLCVREWAQKRDKPGGIWRHWPWTDTLGYAAGIVIAVLVGVLL